MGLPRLLTACFDYKKECFYAVNVLFSAGMQKTLRPQNYRVIGNIVVVLDPQFCCKDTNLRAAFGVPEAYPYAAVA
jgi:hypothetical protein